MARSHFRYVVRDDTLGSVIVNAKCFLYLEGTVTPVTDAWDAKTGGNSVNFRTSNAQGEVEAWFDLAKTITVRVTDNSSTAYLPGAVGAPLTFSQFDESVEVDWPADATYVPSYTAATLPAASNTWLGRIARVTDSFRGIFRDFGSGGWKKDIGDHVYDVRDFGAFENSNTDSSAAFQAALDAAALTGGTILFPGRYYRILAQVNLPILGGSRRVKLQGIGGGQGAGAFSFGAPTLISGASANMVGFRYTGTVDAPTSGGYTFENLSVVDFATPVYISNGQQFHFRDFTARATYFAGNNDNFGVLLENAFWVFFQDVSLDAGIVAVNNDRFALGLRGATVVGGGVWRTYHIYGKRMILNHGGIVYEQNTNQAGAPPPNPFRFEDVTTENTRTAVFEVRKGAGVTFDSISDVHIEIAEQADPVTDGGIIRMNSVGTSLVHYSLRGVYGGGVSIVAGAVYGYEQGGGINNLTRSVVGEINGLPDASPAHRVMVGTARGTTGSPGRINLYKNRTDDGEVGSVDFANYALTGGEKRIARVRAERQAADNGGKLFLTTFNNNVPNDWLTIDKDGLTKATGAVIYKDIQSVASGTSINLPTTGNLFNITGTTAITSIGAASNNGRLAVLKFAGILTMTDGSNLKLAGDFVTAADSTLILICDGTNWYEISRSAN